MDWILLAQDTAVAGEASSLLDSLWNALMSPLTHIVICAVLLSMGIWLLLPPRGRGKQFVSGAVFAALGVLLFLLPTLQHLPAAPVFLLLEGLAVLGGLGTITSRSPVYSAIWFASSLLAIGALLLLNGAQFLGLATVAVYAGAIVVTFLFVLMLAQPEGHAVYDRIGWGWFPTLGATLGGVSVIAILSAGLFAGEKTDQDESQLHATVTKAILSVDGVPPDAQILDATIRRGTNGSAVLNVVLPPDSSLLNTTEATLAQAIRTAVPDLGPATRIEIREKDVLAQNHVARLGGELWGRHLISIQVSAVLLLVALVGAIAMAIHGKDLPIGQQGRAVAR